MSAITKMTTQRLGDIAYVIPGRHLLGENHNTEQRGVPYITGPSDFGVLQATPSRWTEKPDVMCVSGDILITVKGAGVGKLNFAPDVTTCIGRQIMSIRPHCNVVDSWFLYFAIKQQFKSISEAATGATIPGLSIDQIAGIQLKVPPIASQRRIAARLRGQFEQLQQLKSALTDQLAALEKLPGAYLREAFGDFP